MALNLKVQENRSQQPDIKFNGQDKNLIKFKKEYTVYISDMENMQIKKL